MPLGGVSLQVEPDRNLPNEAGRQSKMRNLRSCKLQFSGFNTRCKAFESAGCARPSRYAYGVADSSANRGNRVREIRVRRAADVPAAFTQAAVAARAGVSVTTLRKWETGAARPRQRAAKRLARALGVSVEELGFPAATESSNIGEGDGALHNSS